MAIGVPEADVFKAADAVLARGERPTVERVRVELGRGSPARVGQLLEQWWEHLAQRLKGHALLPDLPGEVAQAYAEVWRLALAHAADAARAALTEDQNALFAEQTTLVQERKLWEIALAEAQANVTDVTAKLSQAAVQLHERQILLRQLETQRNDLLHQRDRLQHQIEQQHIELDALHAERTAWQEHIRVVEDRAHQQIDHARQELKASQQQLKLERREFEKQVAKLTSEQDGLQKAARLAQQDSARKAGEIAALEKTVAQWQKLAAHERPVPRKASIPKRQPSSQTGASRKRTRVL